MFSFVSEIHENCYICDKEQHKNMVKIREYHACEGECEKLVHDFIDANIFKFMTKAYEDMIEEEKREPINKQYAKFLINMAIDTGLFLEKSKKYFSLSSKSKSEVPEIPKSKSEIPKSKPVSLPISDLVNKINVQRNGTNEILQTLYKCCYCKEFWPEQNTYEYNDKAKQAICEKCMDSNNMKQRFKQFCDFVEQLQEDDNQERKTANIDLARIRILNP